MIRYPRSFLSRIAYVTACLTALYVSLVGIGAILIYSFGTNNLYTGAVERIFPYPAAVVQGEVIPLSRVRREIAARAYINERDELGNDRETIVSSVFDLLATRIHFAKFLQEHGIAVRSSDLDASMKAIYERIDGEENLRLFLQEEYGGTLSFNDFRQLTKEFLVQSSIEQQLLTRATVRHILVALPENPTPEQVDAGKRKIDAIRTEIPDKETFIAKVADASEDTASRDSGGSIGIAARGTVSEHYSADFEQAIFELPIDEISVPIRSRYGWHLILVDKREGSVNESIEGLAERLKEEYPPTRLIHRGL